jgi:S-DNA-T family DNA segregation ATPase FtsK/SpoIIIE
MRSRLREAHVGKPNRPDPLTALWVTACLFGAGCWWIARRPRAAGPVALTGVLVLAPTGVLYVAAAVVMTGAGVVALRRPKATRAVLTETRRKWTHSRKWNERMVACKLGVEGKAPVAKQTVREVWGERIRIELPAGMAPEDVRKRTPQLAWTFDRRPGCRVKVDGEMVWLEFSDGNLLREAIPAPEIPNVTNLEAIRLGLREDGSPWTLRVWHPERGYRHLFVAGGTGAGKSVLFWQAFREMAPAIEDGLLELRVADPKFGVEFGRGEPMFAEYADDDEGIAAMLRKAREDMQARGARMKEAGVAQHSPSRHEPAIGVVVDEFPSLLRDCEDPKLAKQMEKDARILMRMGRVFGVFLWAATQDPRVESFSLRTFFSDEVGLRVRDANQVDMIFGKGARDAGATLDLISADMPGTGFELREDGVSMVRSFYVSGDLIAELVDRCGRVPDGVELDRAALAVEWDGGEA